MASGPEGVRAALETAIDLADEPEEAVQEQLFGMLDLDETETGALDAPSPLSDALVSIKRKGRPKGSKNRRTEAVVGWLLQQHRHPVSVMMEAYSMSTVELAAKIGVSMTDADVLLDLFKLQMRMAEASAPYVAQRLPQAVQIDAKAGLTLAFSGVSLPALAGSAGNSQVLEGVALPFKSDGESRTDD